MQRLSCALLEIILEAMVHVAAVLIVALKEHTACGILVLLQPALGRASVAILMD